MSARHAGASAIILAALSIAVPAQGAVRYIATIQAIGTIDYTAPDFITVNPTDVSPAAANCQVAAPLSTFACTNVRFLPNPGGFDTIAINYSPLGFPQTIAGSFMPGAFGAFGSYTSADGGLPLSTLTVSAAGGVPEPATWAMLIGGVGLIGGAVRRRRAAGTAREPRPMPE